jgi:hypothetical protein
MLRLRPNVRGQAGRAKRVQHATERRTRPCLHRVCWVSFCKPHSAGHADIDAANQVMVICQVNCVKAVIVERRGGVWFPEKQNASVNAPGSRNLPVPVRCGHEAPIGSDDDGPVLI